MVQFEAKDLSFWYADTKKENSFCLSPVLNQVNFQIHQGEFVLLVGENGCGKTTLLRQLKPQLTPFGKREGELFYEGESLTLQKKKTVFDIGYVMQNPENQIVTDKVWHEMVFGLENMGLEQEEMEQRIAQMVHFFDMGEWYEQTTSTLSGGQKQILALASVMAMGPKVLILDEVTSQLDPIAAREFMMHVKRLHEEYAITIIMCEHNPEYGFQMADRVLWLEDGRVKAFQEKRLVAQELYQSGKAYMLPIASRFSLSLEKEAVFQVSDARRMLEQTIINNGNREEKDNDMALDKKVRIKQNGPLLEAKGIWYAYERNAPFVLKGLSLSLNKSKCSVLIGANGCGKSTLLKVLTGSLHPVDGKRKLTAKSQVASLPQNPQTLFLEESVEGCLKRCELYPENGKEIIRKLALDNFLMRHPYDLSLGQQQRVAFGMLLLQPADVLLLDEPTKGLDAFWCEKIVEWVIELKKEGKAILLVTHDLEFAAKVADECAILFDGKLVGKKETELFFKGNQIYTTVCARISRGITKECMTQKMLWEHLQMKEEPKCEE